MQLEADHGFRSTLYFLPSRIVPWHPYDPDFTFSDRVTFDGRVMPLGAMIRAIHSRGWEIGLHGTFHSATEPGVLAMQKDELEAELGQPIRTVRQHYLQYDPTVTPGIHAAAGLIADGTHGFNDLLGFRAGTAFPYRCWDWATRAPAPLWEVPLHIQDGALLRDNPTVDVAVARCLPLLDAVQSVGGCLSILFHPARLATDSGFAVYRALLGEAKRRGAWGCGTAQLVDWWQARTSAGAAAVSTG
jgi:peptidoglycan/xylan/chitin deacetylase (PgdA/CDA1 family)